jgi:hypothetical protein
MSPAFMLLRAMNASIIPPVSPTIRTLKIEAVGEFWRGLIKPKIRLTGHWLERAGFKPGTHVQVICVAPGVIELRSGSSQSSFHSPESLSSAIHPPTGRGSAPGAQPIL